MPSFFDTHPPTVERAAGAAVDAARVPRAADVTAREAAAYLRHVDGLVVGTDPAGGFFEDSRFVHPDLDFTIRFPTGWRTVNSPAAVGALAPDGSTRVALEFAGQGDDPKPFADAFVAGRGEELDAKIERARAFELNGLRAYELRGEAGGLRGRLLFVAHRGSVYRIASVSGSFAAKRNLSLAQIAARSFRPLTPEERAAVTVERLRLVEAQTGETLDALARRSASAWDANELALANALPAREPLERGRLVKIAAVEPYRSAGAPPPGAAGAPR